MAKISKKNMKKKSPHGSKKSTTLSKKGKSKEMKKGKKGESIKKMMEGEKNKPRQAYCLKCKEKVSVTKYNITKTPKGVFQLRGECNLGECSKKPTKVFCFLKSSEFK
jgi:hypothetical protein|tara:strand:- start:88 stop:411 length:324 start_codon:yes stop_codon:yes gene_type:complete